MNKFNRNDSVGHIQISNEVIAVIVGTATLEVPGVYSLSGNITGEISEMLGRKNFSKGIEVEISDNEVTIDISLTVRFGEAIQSLGETVQEKVKIAVETMTGLQVKAINIHVTAVQPAKEINK